MTTVREACLDAQRSKTASEEYRMEVWAAAIERGVSYRELSLLLGIPINRLWRRVSPYVSNPPLDREMLDASPGG